MDIRHVSFWIIVSWLLKTVEIVTNNGKHKKQTHTQTFCQPRRNNCLKILLEILKIAEIGQKIPNI